MKRIRLALTAALAVAASASVATAQPAPDFGVAPNGEIPILFNDHHVYAKPDTEHENRVLAAIVRGNTILVPLRSMFEQMGATVSYDAATRTVVVSKQGSEVKVTVGRPEVIINGESRPLDVPPEIYQGSIVVPIRVLSEGMGAYVLWLEDRKTVVIRYIAPPMPIPTPIPTPVPTLRPTPVPTPVPTLRPTPVPTPVPTLRPTPVPTPIPTPIPTPVPTPTPVGYEHFVAADYIISPVTYNEFSNNATGGSSYAGRAVFELPFMGLPLMVEADARQASFGHPAGFVTNIGNRGSTFVPGFTGSDRDLDVRLGLKVMNPRIYLGAGYLWRNTSYGYPQQNGFGFGAEKLPDLEKPFSIYGSAWYYPTVRGGFRDPGTGQAYTLAYGLSKYSLGVALPLFSSGGTTGPLFFDAGFQAERGDARSDAPGSFIHYGYALGLGLRF